MGDKKFIELLNVSKQFGETVALNNIHLFIRNGEFLTLLGPSGCGKTTMLRIIAGFESASSGRVLIDGKNVSDVPPHKRRVNTVFQKYALFPHLNVFDNVAFALKIRKKPKDEIHEKVNAMLSLVGLGGFQRRDVEQLSGGQQQRVAIARALVNEPEALLLDEPLGALDLQLRKDMQLELKHMQQRLGITFIYVTHDQEEALTMSDTIVVMKAGEIQQIGTPVDIYNEPKNAFVADFIGESNILPGVMRDDYLVTFNGCDFQCVDSGFGRETPVDVVVRPEDIKLVDSGSAMLHGQVLSTVFMGVHYEMQVLSGDSRFLIHSTTSAEEGSTVGLDILPNDIHIMKRSIA